LPFIKKSLLYSTFIISFICIALWALPVNSSAIKPTKVKLQLFWHHQFEFAGFYAAIEQGYFDKYNIDVELLKYEPSTDITSLVLNGEAQFGLAGTDLIKSFHQGKKVKLLASYFKRSPLVIISQPEISSLKQLLNQEVYGYTNQLKQGSIRRMLNLFNVDPAKINMIMIGDPIRLFENKTIAGILTYRTIIPFELNQKDIPYKLYDPNQFGITSQDLNLFTSSSFAKENPELVQNFTLAANDGWRYAIKHPDELITLIKSKYNSQNKSKEALKFEASETIKLMSPELFTVGSIQKNKLVSISEESFVNKTISKIKKLDDFIFQLKKELRISPDLFDLLSAEEKDYLSKNPIIKVQNESDYAPFNYTVNGMASGYSIDYIRFLSAKMGVTIKFIQNKSWHEYLEMLKNNQLDAMVNIMATKERKQFYNFTTPYAEPNKVAVTRVDDLDDIINKDSIKKKRLVVVGGYAASNKYEKMYPSMTIIKVTNVLAALRKISTKEADVFISNSSVINFLIEKHYIADLKLVPIAKELEYSQTFLSIATNIRNSVLANIFQKAMSTVAEHETLALRRKWFTEIKSNKKIVVNLSQSEKAYLINNPILRTQNDGNYPPFNYLIDGKPSGYSIDLINSMAEVLGLKVELAKGKSWPEYRAMLKNKELDALINIIDIESRHDFAAFTSPFAEISTFAASRKKEFSAIISKDILVNKRIAITKGYAINKQLKESLPRSTFIEVKNTVEALELISSNQADVYFEAGAVLDYFITKKMIPNLQLFPVSSDLEVVNQKFSIATRKDNKTLLSILQKAMNAIPDIEHIRLKRKWFGENKKEHVKKDRFTKEELAFIANSNLTVCRPYPILGSNMVIPLIDLITRDVGLNIKVGPSIEWSATFKALENKECDIVLEVTKTEKRAAAFNFTPEYFRDKVVIVTKIEQNTILDIYDHLSETFGVLNGSSLIPLLKHHYPNIKLKEVKSSLDGFALVKQANIWGYINPLSFTNTLFQTNTLTGVKINTQLRGKFDDLQAIATRKEDKVLHSILSKALANTDKNEIEKLINNNHLKKDVLKIDLSIEEKLFLKNKQIIWCLGSRSKVWDELIPYLASMVKMNVIKSSMFSRTDALMSLENYSCDFIPEVRPMSAGKQSRTFSPSIHKEDKVIVTTDEHKFISGIEDYLDQTFSVVEGDLIVEQLKTDYPNIKLKLVKHELDGLQQVQRGEVFAYIASISVMSNTISQFALRSLKISGSLSDKFMDNWTISTRKEDELLSSIFSKIILSIDKKEVRKKLFERYAIKYEQGFDYTLFWQMFIIALFVLTAIIFWNRRLAGLNFQLQISKKVAEEAQQKVESQNSEILATHKQLVQSEKMASLGTLTAGVAHEINNPTNFTYAAVFMMQNEIDDIKCFLKQLAGGDNADVKVINSFDTKFEKLIELAKTASEGTQRIKVIVEDLRTFARLDDAKQAKIQVSELITSTVHLVQTQFESITINTDFSFNPTLLCFPSKLNQVFMNIIVNACQSIKTKLKQNHQLNSNKEFEGLITISTSRDNDYLVIHIEDNGCGMDEQTKQRVCEPFFTTKDVGSGTGLGMAISFGIIEEHDGMLKILSTFSQGSSFSVYLPLDNNSSDNKS